MDAPALSPRRGDTVELITKPTGYTSRHYNLSVGAHYQVLDRVGSCVVTTSDQPDETAMYHHERVKVVHRPQP